jgi:hypothetical protein
MWWLTPVIPATQVAKIGRISIQGQPTQKINKTPSQSLSCTWWFIPVIPTAQEEAIGRRISV